MNYCLCLLFSVRRTRSSAGLQMTACGMGLATREQERLVSFRLRCAGERATRTPAARRGPRASRRPRGLLPLRPRRVPPELHMGPLSVRAL